MRAPEGMTGSKTADLGQHEPGLGRGLQREGFSVRVLKQQAFPGRKPDACGGAMALGAIEQGRLGAGGEGAGDGPGHLQGPEAPRGLALAEHQIEVPASAVGHRFAGPVEGVDRDRKSVV